MADILIRGMEMPRKCNQIQITIFGEGFSGKSGAFIIPRNGVPSEDDLVYDAIEIRPHGDLIDRDAFRAENEYYLNREFINPKYEDTLDDLLKDAPVIVPSNKEGSK